MKNRMKTTTIFCVTLIATPFVSAEDKAVTVAKKDTAVNKTTAAAKTYPLSATDLLADNNIKIEANIKVVESFTSMGDCERGQLEKQDIQSERDLSMKEVQEESKNFEKAKSDYIAKSTTMSDVAREKEEKKLIKMERDLKNLVAEKEEELKLAMQLATERLAQDLELSIARLAQNENIDIVIDKMTGRAIYVSPSFDITQKAIEEMNKTYKIELAQNAKKAEKATKIADNKAVAAPKAAKVGA